MKTTWDWETWHLRPSGWDTTELERLGMTRTEPQFDALQLMRDQTPENEEAMVALLKLFRGEFETLWRCAMYPTKAKISRLLKQAGYRVTEWPHTSTECQIIVLRVKSIYHVRLGGVYWQRDSPSMARLSQVIGKAFTATAYADLVVVTAKKVRDAAET